MNMIFDEDTLCIYTDGSSYSRPRRGGYAVRFVYTDDSGEEKIKDFEYLGVLGATNNQMELHACVQGLVEAAIFSGLNSINRIIVVTDSQYVTEHVGLARQVWPSNKWMGNSGPIANVELWKDLTKQIRELRKNVSFQWVKGHSKDMHNKAVDKMAKRSAQNCIGQRPKVVTVRKKQFKNIGRSEGVKPCGQKFTIKIFTCEYFKQQRLYKYKYEVMSKRSEHYKLSGIIFYKDPLKSRCSYLVTLSDNENRPVIEKIHREYAPKTEPDY